MENVIQLDCSGVCGYALVYVFALMAMLRGSTRLLVLAWLREQTFQLTMLTLVLINSNSAQTEQSSRCEPYKDSLCHRHTVADYFAFSIVGDVHIYRLECWPVKPHTHAPVVYREPPSMQVRVCWRVSSLRSSFARL